MAPDLQRRISRRRCIELLALAAPGWFLSRIVIGNEGRYPSRPIRCITPFPVGGTSDLLARLVGAQLGEALGQPIVIESRPGAAGGIAMDYAARAAPDGYTRSFWPATAPTSFCTTTGGPRPTCCSRSRRSPSWSVFPSSSSHHGHWAWRRFTRCWSASIDKTLLPPAAEALGIRVPPYAVVRDVGGAVAFAAVQGYPLVLKRRFGFAGEGVAIVRTGDELVRAAPALMRPDQLDLGESRAPQLLVQAFVEGAHHAQAMVAWRGVPLAAFAWERRAATRPVKGQTSVLRFVESAQTRVFAEKLTQAFGICGFFNVQHIVRHDTGEAYLLEINRRVVTHIHMGERVGADLAVALYRHLTGMPARPPDERGAGGTVVVFPREWLRDPESRYLREFPVDIPWDDPELFAAMLAMRDDV